MKNITRLQKKKCLHFKPNRQAARKSSFFFLLSTMRVCVCLNVNKRILEIASERWVRDFRQWCYTQMREFTGSAALGSEKTRAYIGTKVT
jgi:hypothetical protein